MQNRRLSLRQTVVVAKVYLVVGLISLLSLVVFLFGQWRAHGRLGALVWAIAIPVIVIGVALWKSHSRRPRPGTGRSMEGQLFQPGVQLPSLEGIGEELGANAGAVTAFLRDALLLGPSQQAEIVERFSSSEGAWGIILHLGKRQRAWRTLSALAVDDPGIDRAIGRISEVVDQMLAASDVNYSGEFGRAVIVSTIGIALRGRIPEEEFLELYSPFVPFVPITKLPTGT
jgi:hypothetical protein